MKRKFLEHPRLYIFLGIGALCIIWALFLSFSTVHKVRRLPRPIPRQTDVSLIQDWMTVSYVAHEYSIPEPLLAEKLQLDPQNTKNTSLRAVAKQTNQTSQQVVEKVQTIIREFQTQASHPPTPSP